MGNLNVTLATQEALIEGPVMESRVAGLGAH